MCGNRRWTREEDEVLVKAIWRVCVATGASPLQVARRVETLLGSHADLSRAPSHWSAEDDRVCKECFSLVLDRIDRSATAVARRARFLVESAKAERSRRDSLAVA